MNGDLRRALDRAAGEDPQVDLVEAVWAQGRVVRRRRHTARAVGGAVAAAAVAGAFFLGGGLLEPQADVGPAAPTTQETVEGTLPGPTEKDGAEEQTGSTDAPTTPWTDPDLTPASDGLVLTSTSIGGVPLTAPTADLVEVLSAQLGEPFNAQVDVVGGCGGEEIFSLYNWDELLLHVRGSDGPDAQRSWETWSSDVELPRGVTVGMTMEDVRDLDDVTELPSVASPHYRLGSGIVVATTGGVVATARSERGEVC